ncbi:chloride channel protein [Sphingomonas sp. HT-1]|uniref:chloride channel protein n=1 Tax=unclassified Sphingomonas TaxID=196159 RepID=UPI0002E87A72|nr:MULTISPECIES: chloride channel protein [unclassified Sphingomonas]KTF67386.1 chloride channel protein [Sphingomonas sp. WG]
MDHHRNARRMRAIVRRHGPTAPMWRRRIAFLGGAIVIGLVALAFAIAADWAAGQFASITARAWWLPVLLTPAGFALFAWATRRFAPDAIGSGIPQVMAATRNPEAAMASLTAARTVLLKLALTVGAVLVGASTGREGPTVQVAASIMGYAHRFARVRLRASAYIAGGAAGVAAAFNTPLAGVAFAIEELAAAYEQRMAVLVMAAVLIAGMTSLGIAGDYVYFGAMRSTLPLAQAILAAPVAGVVGGLAGALFARAMLAAGGSGWRPLVAMRRHTLAYAAGCGLVVALIGVASGLTWGTGYDAARTAITGGAIPWWYAPAKFVATLATAVAGIPGGIFAPSLSVGAGVGDLIRPLFPTAPGGTIVLLGMVAYFTGVVRAPLTAVIIIAETTASRGLMLPLLAAALIADFTAQRVSRERLYHGLSQRFGTTQVQHESDDRGNGSGVRA